MDPSLDPSLGQSYRSKSQQARVVTEAWVRDNLYCLDCNEDRIAETRPGRSVVDFRCQSCARHYQLKSQRRPFRNRVLDAAWDPMASAVRAGRAPNFLFLHYNPRDWMVETFFGVPGHFVTLSAIEKRPPLASTARRAGWVGCNILLNRLPSDAKVYLMRDREEIPPHEVRERWRRFAFLRDASHESRGWTADVLAYVRRLKQKMFTLGDMYRFEDELSKLHLDNRHIKAKIRQQLQALRDRGVIKFLGGGNYLTVDY